MRRRRSPYRVDGAPHSAAAAIRVADGAKADKQRASFAGPECDLRHRPIYFVRDDDRWRHMGALAGDDVHAAIPQIQK